MNKPISDERKKTIMSVVIYGVILFAVAAILIVASLLINVRNTRRLEDEVQQTQQGAATAQTTLVNVQEENRTLREMLADANESIDKLKNQNAELSSAAETADAHIASLSAIATANMHTLNGRYTLARESLSKVDTALLTEDELAAYERLRARLY